MDVRDVAAGTVLLEADATRDALLLVYSGEVEARAPGRDPWRLGAGSWLGGFAGIDTGPGATLTAVGDVSIGRLAQSAYGALHRDRPALRVALGLSFGAQLAREFRRVAAATRDQAELVAEPAEAAPVVGPEAVEREYDVVVIGRGPHGLAYALWVKQDRPETRIAVVEKRPVPGFKIGESTLGPVIRAWLSLGMPLPALRRLFNNKLGLHFWWTGEETDGIHEHVDQVVEETFQVERRVLELLMMSVARRAGIDVFEDTRALIRPEHHSGPAEGARVRARRRGRPAPARARRLRRERARRRRGPAARDPPQEPDFNTNAYFGYFRKRSDVDLPTWDVAATRHLCFPEGWVWFIELASWEKAVR